MDKLTEWSTHPAVQALAKKLPLPIKLPTLVRRAAEVDATRPLLGRRVLLTIETAAHAALVRALVAAGADLVLLGPADHVHGAAELARAAGRRAEVLPTAERSISAAEVARAIAEGDGIDALLLDVTAIGGPHRLYAALQPSLRKLRPHCRVILMNRVSATPTPAEAAATEGTTGFGKSLARELGGRAITVNMVELSHAVDTAAAAEALAFLATDRARYVTGQRLVLTASAQAAGSTSLAGHHVVVTGAARGIGAAMVTVLARQGAAVSVVDLASAQQAGEAVVSAVRQAGGQAQFIAANVTQRAEVEACLEQAAKLGPVTGLVNNAGITRDRTFAKMSEAQWADVLAVNFDASVAVTEAALAGRRGEAPLAVVFLSSVVGISGNFGQTNYTLSKAAVLGYMRAMAAQWAGKNVRMNAIAPGFIDTALTREVPLLNRELGKQLTCLLQAGEPEDIGEIAAFLLSPAAVALNGQTIRVDGGMFFGA